MESLILLFTFNEMKSDVDILWKGFVSERERLRRSQVSAGKDTETSTMLGKKGSRETPRLKASAETQMTHFGALQIHLFILDILSPFLFLGMFTKLHESS